MKRALIIIVVLLIVGAGIWIATGGLERSAKERIEDQLVAAGLPQPLAECMGTRLSERLTVTQLREFEKLRPEEGEAAAPMTMSELLERARRIEDQEVIEVTATSAAVCAFGGM